MHKYFCICLHEKKENVKIFFHTTVDQIFHVMVTSAFTVPIYVQMEWVVTLLSEFMMAFIKLVKHYPIISPRKILIVNNLVMFASLILIAIIIKNVNDTMRYRQTVR